MNPAEFRDDAPGRLVRTPEGAWAFVPAPLPPELYPSWDLMSAISDADRAIAELGGVAANLPNPHLLIVPFMRREAVLSSRIEGTRSSFEDLIAFEAGGAVPASGSADVQEVANYVRALQHGLALLSRLPISLRMIREVHSVLMQGVRGESKQPGEFRKQQNWIGPNVFEARFVPPPIPEMTEALDAFEKYLHAEPHRFPPLVRLALTHYQFETIHPFLDGNGRVGRLLVTLSLCADELLPSPLLYLSAFFEREKERYTELLLNVSRRAAWEDWIRFFLRGITEQAKDGVARAKRILGLREDYRKRLQSSRASASALRLVDELVAFPTTTAAGAASRLGQTVPGAQKVIDRLIAENILVEVPNTRPRLYVASEVVAVFQA